MSATEKTPAQKPSAARSNVLATVAVYEVRGAALTISRTARSAMLYLATPQGEVRARMELGLFVKIFRAAQDHNGNVIPAEVQSTEAVLAADAAELPPASATSLELRAPRAEQTPITPEILAGALKLYAETSLTWDEVAERFGVTLHSLRRTSDKQQGGDAMTRLAHARRVALRERCLVALERLQADPALTVRDVAPAVGLDDESLAQWIRRHDLEWWASHKLIQRTRRRVANGQSVSDAARAEAGLPLPKPAERDPAPSS